MVKVQVETQRQSIAELQPVVDELWALSRDFSDNSSLTVRLTGVPAIRVEAFTQVQLETIRFTTLGALAGVVMAILLMRRLAIVLIVCCVSAIGAFWSMGAMGLVGEKITVLTTVLPMLVMIVALTDSIHIAFDRSMPPPCRGRRGAEFLFPAESTPETAAP